MNIERRQSLERLFDREPPVGDPAESADDPEARVYLRQLDALRALSRRHDPSASAAIRRPPTLPPRRGRPPVAGLIALAASLLLSASLAWPGRRPDRVSGVATAVKLGRSEITEVPPAIPRPPRPSVEVELYRWANAASPGREDAARILLSGVEAGRGRRSSREVLALVLANSSEGPAASLARSVSARPAVTRRLIPSHRHRVSPGA